MITAGVREGSGRNSGVGELFAFPAAEASPDWDTSRIQDLKNSTSMASDQQAPFSGTLFPARKEVSRHTSAEMTKIKSPVLCPTSYPQR